MGNYSKLIAALIGAFVTALVTFDIVDTGAATELEAALGTVLTTALVYLFPPNEA